MNSSPSLIKANGTLNGKIAGNAWLPLELPATPQNGTHARTAQPILRGVPLTDGKTNANGHVPPTHPIREPVTWQPAEFNGFQSLPAANVQISRPVQPPIAPPPPREAIPDLADLRKRLIEETAREGQARASELLQTAQQQAADILAQAKANAAEVTRQAHEEGLAAAQTEAERLLRTSQTIVDEVHAWRESMLAQSEAAVLNLVTDIARTMFGNGLALDPEVLRETFTRALSEAKQLGDLLVHLHPTDVTVLDRAWLESQTASRTARVELVPDPAIRRGGCLVEGQYGQVDARVETKWSIVEQALTDTHTHAKSEGAAA